VRNEQYTAGFLSHFAAAQLSVDMDRSTRSEVVVKQEGKRFPQGKLNLPGASRRTYASHGKVNTPQRTLSSTHWEFPHSDNHAVSAALLQ
jgi:hypothetical protein